MSSKAETESPKYGKLIRKGVVRGPRLDGTLTWFATAGPRAKNGSSPGKRT